jgi:hypothetical protein
VVAIAGGGGIRHPGPIIVSPYGALSLRWQTYFTPTSALWVKQVETFFALLTELALKRGVFRSVAEREKALTVYIKAMIAARKLLR